MKQQICGLMIVLGCVLAWQPMVYAVDMNPMDMMKKMNPMKMMKDRNRRDDGYYRDDRRYAPPRSGDYYPPRDYDHRYEGPRDDYYARSRDVLPPYPPAMGGGAYPERNIDAPSYAPPALGVYPDRSPRRYAPTDRPDRGYASMDGHNRGYAPPPLHPGFQRPPSGMPSLMSPLGNGPAQPPVRIDEWWN